MKRLRLSSWLAVLLIATAGCVQEKIEPAYIPNVSTTQNSDGLVTISWPSRRGYNYRLVARINDEVIVDKKVHPGTGQTIVVEFNRDPQKPLPAYSVLPEKLEK